MRLSMSRDDLLNFFSLNPCKPKDKNQRSHGAATAQNIPNWLDIFSLSSSVIVIKGLSIVLDNLSSADLRFGIGDGMGS